jgi:hypothetical protein
MQNYSYILWLVNININGFSIHIHIIGKIYESSFQRNKRCIFSTSELGVMSILVEVAQAVLWLREKPRTLQFLHQDDLALAFFMLMFTPN